MVVWLLATHGEAQQQRVRADEPAPHVGPEDNNNGAGGRNRLLPREFRQLRGPAEPFRGSDPQAYLMMILKLALLSFVNYRSARIAAILR